MTTSVTKAYPAFFLHERPVEAFRQQLTDYFLQTWTLYERLFEVIKDDSSYYLRPCSLRHPLIFYFGHTATFFMNKLVLAKQLQRINPSFESMFAIGVDEMSWDDLNDAHYDWPSVEQVRHYRQQVKAAIIAHLAEIDIQFPVNWQSPVWPILMGIEHERIHLETSSVLIRQLPIDCVQPHTDFPLCPHQQTPAPQNSWQTVMGGTLSIDHQDPAPLYGWDNEYGSHQATVATFQAARMLVSNAEFLSFVEAGGYQTPRYWTDEGQGWLAFSQAAYPTFWLQDNTGYRLRTMTDIIDMPWSWPVEVNYLEAKAYCNWLAEKTQQPVRLPSEDEYLHLRAQAIPTSLDTAIGLTANLNLSQWASSTPVDANPHGDFFDLVGNVWQWTETPIYPFDGFRVHPLYDDFTTPTFDNKHNIFKGGSWISTGNEANLHSRYAFRRHFFQHAGFRPIISDAPVIHDYQPIETQADVVMACEADYGSDYLQQPNYAQALADHIRQHTPAGGRALLLGSSVGRSCFALVNHFDDLTGMDFSARFISVADQLQQTGRIRYRLSIEGEVPEFVERTLASLQLAPSASIRFMQQDANNLKPIFTGYDVMILNGIFTQLTHPKEFLAQLHERINDHGMLIIADDYDSQCRAEGNDRLGGYKKDGENVTSFDTLHDCLTAHFTLVQPPFDLPLIERKDARHATLRLRQVSYWQKRHA